MAVMDTVKKWSGWSQMLAGMLAVQVFATGQQLLSKVILTQGTFIFALMAYRHLVAALCVAPLAFFFERFFHLLPSFRFPFIQYKTIHGRLTSFAMREFEEDGVVDLVLALHQCLNRSETLLLVIDVAHDHPCRITAAMGLFYYGLRDTTATYSTNFLNIIPIVTFLLSVIFRIEKLGLGSKAGKIKTAGAFLCVGGALTASLYKGKSFHVGDGHHFHRIAAMDVSSSHWTRGTFMLVGSCVCYASWYILQVKLLKVFPSKYRATLVTCIIASLQSAAIGLCLDRSKAAWRLEWNLQLITIVYSGVLSTAATFCLLTWSIAKRGPTYAPMFNPLTLVFVAISETLLLGEQMWLGTVLGTVMIIMGLYSFLWGKRKEMKLAESSELAEAVPPSVELKKTLEPV
ncbi:hypothetical protein V6N11_058974 [Hibiscus sabdariffa]|uniref:WAT1-related protein n=1 Tax=Hibiscus sabdariffa TaxID=183260 RepID=A0ABR2U642_9ROSI